MFKNKIFYYIAVITALIFCGVFFSKTFAFDLVSSPTSLQSGIDSYTVYDNVNINFDSGSYIESFLNYGALPNSIHRDMTSGLNLPSNVNLYFWYYYSYNPSSPTFGATLTKYFFFNHVTKGRIDIESPPFFDGTFLTKLEGPNVVTYQPNFTTMSLGSPIQTLPKPSPSFGATYGTVPVYLIGPDSAHNAFVYQGTDGKPYIVNDGFGSGTDIPLSSAGVDTGSGNAIPIGTIYNDDFILARQASGSGNLYLGDSRVDSTNFEMSTDYILSSFNFFANPIAYFSTSTGITVKWDLNCMTPGYDSCRLFSGAFKCSNNAGTQSPGGELCGGTVTAPTEGGSTGSAGYVSYINGQVCTTKNYPIFSSTPYSIGDYTFSDNSSGATISDSYKFQWLSSDGSNRDMLSVYPSTGLYLDRNTFTGGLNAGVTTTIYSDFDEISAGNPTSLAVTLTRSGQTAIVNYVKIKTENQGFSPLTSNQKNIVADVVFRGIDGTDQTYPLVYSGGYATALSRFPSSNIKIKFTIGTVTFDGFEIGYSNSGTTSKTSCRSSDFSCEFTQHSPGDYSCDSELNVSGIPQGECEIIGNICQPKSGTVPYYDGAIVPGGAIERAINASGAVVGLDYNEEDIFYCSESGLFVLKCPFQVLSRVWSKFTFIIKKLVNLIYGISSIGSPSGQGNIFSFIVPEVSASTPELSTPFDISGSGNSSEVYAGADMLNLNKTILRASDNVFSMDSSGIKGIYALSMWFLILVGVIGVIVIFLTSFR